MIGKTTLRPQLWNDMRDAIEDAESALLGCEQVDWQALSDLMSLASPKVILRLSVSVGEFRRLKTALDRLNEIVNDPDYGRIS